MILRLTATLTLLLSTAILGLALLHHPKVLPTRRPVWHPATAAPAQPFDDHPPLVAAASSTRPMPVSRDEQRQPLDLGTLDITAYCPTGNPTASGEWPEPGMAATLDRSVPFGTRLRIVGVGTVTVEDRAGCCTDVDVFMRSCADADRFGRQHRHVEEMP